MDYCPSCGKYQNQEQPKTELIKQPSKKKQKGVGWGKIIGGIIMVIITVVSFPYMSQFQAIHLQQQERCNSFIGEVEQGLDSTLAAQCRDSLGILSTINTMLFVIGIIGFLGLVFVILGIAKK